MDWLLAMTYGAIGGAVVEAVVSGDRVLAWNSARRRALARTPAAPVPALTAYVDPSADVAAGITRILLGAVAGSLLHGQVTGAYAAIAVGCAAPAVVRQLGSARLSPAFGSGSGAPEAESGEERASSVEPVPAEAATEPEHSSATEPAVELEHSSAAEPAAELKHESGVEPAVELEHAATTEPAAGLEPKPAAEEHA